MVKYWNNAIPSRKLKTNQMSTTNDLETQEALDLFASFYAAKVDTKGLYWLGTTHFINKKQLLTLARPCAI